MDRTLVEAAQAGDEDAFAALARGSANHLFAVAYRILRDVGYAEDAVQHTLVAAWRELPRLRDADRFDAWLRRILVRACYAESRRARSWTANVRMLPLDGPSQPDPAIGVVLRDAVERGFRRLPTDQRAVLVLHHYLGLPLAEVAEILDVPLGTVKSRLYYATRALRAALDADARPALQATRERPA